MTTPSIPDPIVSAWLEEGPNELPDVTRRAIAVGVRTTNQRRHGLPAPWRIPTLNGLLPKLAFATVAVAFALGGLYVIGGRAPESSGGVGGQPAPSITPSPSPSPSSSLSSSSAALPALTETFKSSSYGYSIGHAAGWTVTPSSKLWLPPDTERDPRDRLFDNIYIEPDGRLRAGSAVVPAGAAVDDWIDESITGAEAGTCNPPRATLPEITIDGQVGRVRAECPNEVEATVVVGRRVYVFTLFQGDQARDGIKDADARAVFDAFAATIDLRPADIEFASADYGYSVGVPSGWAIDPASMLWWPPAKTTPGDYSAFDFVTGEGVPDGAVFRAASAEAPEGVSVDDWIDEFITGAEAGTCNPPRVMLPEITIDGQVAKIRAGCPDEVEATVVVGRRAYVFTLFSDSRAAFDAIVATIDLRPEAALEVPTPAAS